MDDDYRQQLRQLTHPAHERVDQAMSRLDIAEVSDLKVFLAIHRDCFDVFCQWADPDDTTRIALERMITCLDQDLERLGVSLTRSTPAKLRSIDPLALAYMIEGSRLGTKLLRRRWAASKDAEVCAARAYFSMEAEPGRWQQVCRALSEIPSQSARAAAITRDTLDMFAVFEERAANAALRGGQAHAIV